MKKNESWNSILDNLRVDYLKALDERILLLKNLTAERNIPQLESEYHKLKGTGKTYGFPEVSDVCHEMERLTRIDAEIPAHLLNAGPLLLQYCLDVFKSPSSALNLEQHPDYISVKNATKETFHK